MSTPSRNSPPSSRRPRRRPVWGHFETSALVVVSIYRLHLSNFDSHSKSFLITHGIALVCSLYGCTAMNSVPCPPPSTTCAGQVLSSRRVAAVSAAAANDPTEAARAEGQRGTDRGQPSPLRFSDAPLAACPRSACGHTGLQHLASAFDGRDEQRDRGWSAGRERARERAEGRGVRSGGATDGRR
jgi:hypothetical protein